MVQLSFADATPVLDELRDVHLDKLRPKPICFYPYLKRVLGTQWEKLKPQFPMDIKIPKPNRYLLQKDFEPAQVIHLEEPLRMEDGTPVWFENTMDQAYLRFGYENMDARFISSQKFDMEFIRATCSATGLYGEKAAHSGVN